MKVVLTVNFRSNNQTQLRDHDRSRRRAASPAAILGSESFLSASTREESCTIKNIVMLKCGKHGSWNI